MACVAAPLNSGDQPSGPLPRQQSVCPRSRSPVVYLQYVRQVELGSRVEHTGVDVVRELLSNWR